MTDIPDDAVQLAESFEGFRSHPYRDPAGVWTIGYGSTRDGNGNPVTETTQPVSMIQATGLMRRDLTSAATVVSKDVRVSLSDDGAAGEFARWDHAGGVVLAGLLRRRDAERNEFLKGMYT